LGGLAARTAIARLGSGTQRRGWDLDLPPAFAAEAHARDRVVGDERAEQVTDFDGGFDGGLALAVNGSPFPVFDLGTTEDAGREIVTEHLR
jgi:hypothetical protein